MKFLNITYISIFFLLLISGCKTDDIINIEGSYPEGSGRHLYITRIDVDIPVFIDSVRINKSGIFKSRFSYTQPAYYNVGFDDSDFVTVIAYPGDNITLSFSGKNTFENYSVDGSKESDDIRLLDIKLGQTISSLDSISTLYTSLPEGETDMARKVVLETQYTELIKAQRMHNIKFILDNLNSFASIKALFQRINDNAYVLYQPTDAQYLKLVSDSLNTNYPDSKQAIALAQNLKDELAALNLSRISTMAEGIEDTNLDLNLTDLSGKRIKLSSFEGKDYVLLSFWSAGLKECISNNLQMKEYYKIYHRKGFEIYQVNLDEDEEVWKRTVAYDELPWINVREDDPANTSLLVYYNINRLPANYLIDMNGDIIGKNLFGRTLQIRLAQIFD